MNATFPKTLGVAVGMALLGAGCVGNGPNTGQGAVGGAALGAIAGGVIGNNVRGGSTLGGAVVGAAAGGLAGAAVGNSVDHQRGTIYQPSAPAPTYGDQRAPVYSDGRAPVYVESEAQTVYVVQQPPAPPPPRREVVVARPRREAIWVEGYWAYAGRNYEWVPGHWEVPPPHRHTYVRPHWEQRSNGYVYFRGEWR